MAANQSKKSDSKGKQLKSRAKGRRTSQPGAAKAASLPKRKKRPSKKVDHARTFEDVTGRFGVGLAIMLEERQGEDIEKDMLCVSRFSAKPGQRPRTHLLGLSDPEHVASLLAGLAHPDRVRLARAMAIGACTHEALSNAVPLKTGPLYHHLRELERAGISQAVARNTYGLTELGRLTLFVVGGLAGAASMKSPWKHKAVKRRTRK